MPTIDALAPALSAADTDELMVSQAGVARRVTRAQLLAGTQPALALAQNALLGRQSPGTGAPESIGIGANLTLANGFLSAPPPFAIASLPQGQVPAAADRVAVGQGGGNAGISYADFMSGLGAVPGVDGSLLLAIPDGAGTARTLAEVLADSVAIESFGAVGDGLTDDSAALAAAIASGRPVRFGARVYRIDGPFSITTPAVLLGVPGETVLRRGAQAGTGPWIGIGGASFRALDIRFDANRAGVALDGGVVVLPGCLDSVFVGCGFTGAPVGSGVLVSAAAAGSDPTTIRHALLRCVTWGNAAHGVEIQAAQGARVLGCRAHDNGGAGIRLDAGVVTAEIAGNECRGNALGISVGDLAATSPAALADAGPGVAVFENRCDANSGFGVLVAGAGHAVRGNRLAGNGAGVRALLAAGAVAGNHVFGGSAGIDCAGSAGCEVADNIVSGAATGINAGGGRMIRVARNTLRGNTGAAVVVRNVETDANGVPLGIAANGVAVTENWIEIAGVSALGVSLIDGPGGVVVARNLFFGGGGAAMAQALSALTDSVIIEGNRWNNAQRFVRDAAVLAGTMTLQVPDIADGVMVTQAADTVHAILTDRQVATLGQVTFVRVTNGGFGYTHAQVAIGGGGTGATAVAYVSGGQVIGIAVTNPGAGYGGVGAVAGVAITGDGVGATATAFVGLPVPEERRLDVSCNCAVRFAHAGAAPAQDNWTGTDFTVPADAAVTFAGCFGAWRAIAFAADDYLSPDAAGGVALRSMGGDVVLHPAAEGRVRIASDAEPAGVVSCVGRGGPNGVVTAPPGSDYRNLDGGAGATFWVKQSGTGASGWVAIA